MFNVIRFYTLYKKETIRFLKVWSQTILSPVILSVLYFAVFGGALSSRISDIEGVSYLAFIIPGLAMMQSTQNAYQNPSSSLIISKYHGTVKDILTTPLSGIEKTLGYMMSGVTRGIIVAIVIFLVAVFFMEQKFPEHFFLLILVFFIANSCFALLGIISGIKAKTFDDTAGLNTFLIMPMGFLGGVFYSLDMLPDIAAKISLLNPFLYFVDLSRYAFFGDAQFSPFVSFGVLMLTFIILFALCVYFLSTNKGLKPE